MTTGYGFVGLQDLFSQRVSEVGVDRVYTAIQETAAEYNRVVDAMFSGWVGQTDMALMQIELPGDSTLQPIDEWGNPLPVQPSGNYQMGFPIQGGGIAHGTNRVSQALMTVEEANRLTMEALQADANWMLRHLMAAVLTSTAWTYNDKAAQGGYKGLGNISVKGLANGDSVTYLKRGGVGHATDNHYLAQAAAIADANNPFPTIRSELIEHPSNRGPFICYTASNLVSSIGGLSEFVEVDDMDVVYGDGNDTLPANALIGVGPGTEVLGKLKSSNIWVVEMPILPSNYLITRAQSNMPVAYQRSYPADSLKGLIVERQKDWGLDKTQFIRYAGFGVANRVGAVAMEIGDGTWTDPTDYTAPLAV